MEDEDDLRAKIEDLKRQHRDLDERITEIMNGQAVNMILLQQLKKAKLRIKDEMNRLESLLLPDIIA